MIYYVGIDISKYKHDLCIISNTGEVIVKNSSFENNKKGFQDLLEHLKSYDKSQVHIAFEATGHYSMNLELFLIDKEFSFMKINPLIIKQFFKTRSLRRTKTDKADALNIAEYLMSIPYKPNSLLLYHTYSLKSLCRTREQLIKERSKFAVLLTNELDKSFPELKPFFNNIISSTLLFILDKYKNPSHIALMKDYDSIRCISRGKFTYAKFAKLKELNPSILSIPGIGEITAASIISEYGDISCFSSSAKMLAFAGLEPSINQSGTLESNGKMVKHGSGHLRYVLMNASLTLLKFNPTFYDYYLKKRSEGKSHRVALSHVCKKLVRLIYTLETKHVDFDPSLLK